MRARLVGVVAQLQHDQRVAQPGEAEPHPPLGHRLGVLLLQRPGGDVEYVVQHAGRDLHHLGEALVVERGLVAEGLAHEAGQVDRAQAAAAVGRQRLLGAGVGGLDRLAVVEVVVAVDAVEEQDARLGVVVGRAHDLLPQLARRDLAVDPQAVVALVAAVLGPGLGLVHQLDVLVLLHRQHELVGHPDRDVEVGQLALVLGVDEVLDVGMVAAQHPHLRPAPRAGRLHGFARAVEHAHIGNRAAGARMGALHLGALGADRREVVAHAAAAAHRFGRLLQRGVDTGLAVDDLRDRVPDRLHEAVDQRGLHRDPGRGIDPAGRNEAVLERTHEAALPVRALVLRLRLGQRARHAAAHLLDARLLALGVLLDQRVARNFLRRKFRGGDRVGAGLVGFHPCSLPVLGFYVAHRIPVCAPVLGIISSIW